MKEAMKFLKRGLRDTFTQACKLLTPRKKRADQLKAKQTEAVGGHPFRGARIYNLLNVIELPDLNAAELVLLAVTHGHLTYFNGSYKQWDFYRSVNGKPISGRGKRFEFLTWRPKPEVSSEGVRDHFRTKGSSGHTGAFTAWIKDRMPRGYCASIPDDDDCWRDSDGRFFVSRSFFNDHHRTLNLQPFENDWVSAWVFVAFREW